MSKIQLLVGSLHKLLVVDSIEDIDFEQLCEIAQKLKVEITVCSSFEFDSVIMMQAIFKFISKLRRHIKGSENYCMENCKLATIKRSCIRLCQVRRSYPVCFSPFILLSYVSSAFRIYVFRETKIQVQVYTMS